MAKPVTLDIDLGSDASSVKTDSSSVSDKRFSESAGHGSGIARTQESGVYGGPQASPMGGPVPGVPGGYDPSRGSLPGVNAAVTMGNEFGARPTPNGALGQTTVDSAGRRPGDQSGRPMPETGARQATDPTGRPPLFDGKPLMDQTGRTVADSGGRPMVDASGRPLVDQSGRPLAEQTGRPLVDSINVDQSGRPHLEQTGRPLVDSTGRPLLDFAGNPIMDFSGRQLPESILRYSTDRAGQPVAGGYPDPSGRPPPMDQTGRPMMDHAGRPVVDHPDGSGRPVTDVTGRPLPDSIPRPTDQSGRPLPPDHGVRGANDFGYGVPAERGSQPKLDPAGRPMFDASGRMIMEPIPVEQGYRAAGDATGKTIVDPHLGPIGDIHGRSSSTAVDSTTAVGANPQRFDVHGRPLSGDVVGLRPEQDVTPRLVAGQRGPEASLSEGMPTEPRGRLLPDIESRGVAGGPSVQDWRGDGPRPLGADGSQPPPWSKDRVPGPVHEPPPPPQGVVPSAIAWQGKESDPAITTGQQRPPPSRHVPGEPWRQQPGPHPRYVVTSVVSYHPATRVRER